jgi:hypothetical protein
MTSRNLTFTWRDVIFKQYDDDHQADVPFPITYLIVVPEWDNRDLIFEIPQKITLKTFKHAVLDFCITQEGAEPIYKGEHISVRPRKPWSALRKEEERHEGRDGVPTTVGASSVDSTGEDM